MTASAISAIGFFILFASAGAQRPRYVDYDYQDAPAAAQIGIPPRSYTGRTVSAAPGHRAPVPAQPKPTPVPILKQINRHNDDGSYTYGYEGADGSFKIETKLPTGEVMGKYGYVDDTGKLRVIDYGANRYGFQPAGEGITVAPPTLVDETTRKDGTDVGSGSFVDYDDEPAYAAPPRTPRPQKRPDVFVPRALQSHRAQPAPRLQHVPRVQQIQQILPDPVRSFGGFPQESPLRPAPQQAFHEVPASFAPAPVPSPSPPRFAPPGGFASVPAHAVPAPHSPVPGSLPANPVFVSSTASPARPAPVREHYPIQAPAPAQTRAAPPSSGILLDQLVKQFALPAGAGQPLHDITFGSYSGRTTF